MQCLYLFLYPRKMLLFGAILFSHFTSVILEPRFGYLLVVRNTRFSTTAMHIFFSIEVKNVCILKLSLNVKTHFLDDN